MRKGIINYKLHFCSHVIVSFFSWAYYLSFDWFSYCQCTVYILNKNLNKYDNVAVAMLLKHYFGNWKLADFVQPNYIMSESLLMNSLIFSAARKKFEQVICGTVNVENIFGKWKTDWANSKLSHKKRSDQSSMSCF